MKFQYFQISVLITGICASYLNYQKIISNFEHDIADMRLISFDEGDHRWMPESAKVGLKKNNINFMDITQFYRHYENNQAVTHLEKKFQFPLGVNYHDEVGELLPCLSKKSLRSYLDILTSFFTRYYTTQTGKEAAEWIASIATEIAKDRPDIKVSLFNHSWLQPSVIARIEGTNRSDHVVIQGAHLDSINMGNVTDRAPGADDDGSGTVTILEVFRLLVTSGFRPENTVEFQWYSGEEAGLLGSQDIFTKYAENNVQVKAMFQQDMTGYIGDLLDKGLPDHIAVNTDYVNDDLTRFIKILITVYTDLPHLPMRCGYGCSDHASANISGYPSAFVMETAMERFIKKGLGHTENDTIELLNFEHMLQHAKLTLGYVYELGNWEF